MPVTDSGLQKVIDAINNRMRERGILAVDVARQTGHAPSTVTRLLNGETTQPRWDTLEEIAAVLDLDITDVMKTAYGSLTPVQLDEVELVAIYRKLSEDGQEYLLTAALSFLERQEKRKQEQEARAARHGPAGIRPPEKQEQ